MLPMLGNHINYGLGLTSNFVFPKLTKTVYTPCSGKGCRRDNHIGISIKIEY